MEWPLHSWSLDYDYSFICAVADRIPLLSNQGFLLKPKSDISGIFEKQLTSQVS